MIAILIGPDFARFNDPKIYPTAADSSPESARSNPRGLWALSIPVSGMKNKVLDPIECVNVSRSPIRTCSVAPEQ